MKKITIYSLLALFAVALIFTACTKEEDDVRLDPRLETLKITNVTDNSAMISGFVLAEGDGFTERGAVYDVNAEPTTEDNKVIAPDSLVNNAEYSVMLTGLDFATTYYVRAYAMSGSSPIYGDTIAFTTLPILSTVTTAAVTDITGTTATAGGEVTAEGGAAVTARGVVYSLDPSPHMDSSGTVVVEEGAGMGAYTVDLEGLEGTTTYYVRAYATNSAGTTYGEEVNFTTDVAELTWYIPGGYVAASYPGEEYADWDPAKSPYVKSGEADPNNLEGYIYMAGENNEWKVTPGPTWDNDWGGTAADGTGTLVNQDGEPNITLPGGYYKLNFNATDLTFTYYDAQWGVIGSAVPPYDWSEDVNLIYYPEAQRWRGGVAMQEGEFKFRASDDWALDYGGSLDSPALVQGGSNFAFDAETPAADYAIELDFSTPLDYTYSVHRWGLIGSAVPPYDWSEDVDLTWDAENEVFTVDVTLVDGMIKFRADDDWAVNLGGSLAAMTQDGADIPVTAGTYTVTLNPWDGVATLTAK